MGAKQSLQIRNESSVPIHATIIENGVVDLFSPIIAPRDTHTFVTKRKDYGNFDVLVDVAQYDRANELSSRRYLEDKVAGLDTGMNTTATRLRGMQFQKGRCLVVDGFNTANGAYALKFVAEENKKGRGYRSTLITDQQQTVYGNKAGMMMMPVTSTTQNVMPLQQQSYLPMQSSVLPLQQSSNLHGSNLGQPSTTSNIIAPIAMMPTRKRRDPYYSNQYGYGGGGYGYPMQQSYGAHWTPWNQWSQQHHFLPLWASGGGYGYGGQQQYDPSLFQQQQYGQLPFNQNIGQQQYGQQPFIPLSSGMIVPQQQFGGQQWSPWQQQAQQQLPFQQQQRFPQQFIQQPLQQQQLPFSSQQGLQQMLPQQQQAIPQAQQMQPQQQQQQLPFTSQQGFLPGQQQQVQPLQQQQIPFQQQLGGIQQQPFQQQQQPIMQPSTSLLQQGAIPIQQPQLTNVITQPQQLVQEKGIYQQAPLSLGQQQQQLPFSSSSSFITQQPSSLMSGGSTQTLPYNALMGGQQQQFIPQQQQTSLFPGQQQMYDKQLLASTGQLGNVPRVMAA